MRLHELDMRQRIAARTAKLMFSLSLIFLLCQAVLVVLWVDVPMLVENAMGKLDPNSVQAVELRLSLAKPVVSESFQSATLFLMLAIWPFVVLESSFHWISRPWDKATGKYHLFGLMFCICPSLRMCARSLELGDRIWLPGMGFRQVNRRLRTRLERQFSVPMILIALLIMPVLIVEFFMKTQVAQYGWLRLLLHFSTGAIWFAFAAEFILMVAVADKKLDYCKNHWLDLAIIVLPFISFLRTLRVLKASRAIRLIQVSQITRFARIYRLRGTAVKALRALILLELFQRLAGGPERSIKRMQMRLVEMEEEAKDLRRKIARLQRRQRQQEASDFAASDFRNDLGGKQQRESQGMDSHHPDDADPILDSAGSKNWNEHCGR